MKYPINLDLSKRIVIETSGEVWGDTPSKNVQRIILERELPESGVATSLVRYAPGSSFPKHVHALGEELYVVEGEFVDESGVYPAGTYLRNPAGSSHSPKSDRGCVLFVKLGGHGEKIDNSITIDSYKSPWISGHGGLLVKPLYTSGTVGTALVKWSAGEKFIPHRHFGGEEIFVLSGEFIDEHGRYPSGTWIRNPHLSSHHPHVEVETVILVKTGHLV